MQINKYTLSKFSTNRIFARYAIPGIVGTLAASIAILVDGMFIAKFVGASAFAAVNIVWPVASLALGIYIMFTVGAVAVAGKLIGEGKVMRANLMFTQTLLVAIPLGTLFLILIYVFKDTIQPILGAHGEILKYTNLYILPLLVATFFWGLMFTLAQFAKLDGKPKLVAIVFISASVINIVLDILFIPVLGFGIAGAGWATALSYVVALTIILTYFFTPKCRFKLIRIYGGWNYILKAAFNGFSEFLNSASAGIIPWLFNITAYSLAGNSGILAYSVVSYALIFFTMFVYAVGDSIQPLVSISYGVKKPKKINAFLKLAIKYVSIFSIIFVTVLFVNPSILTTSLLKDVDNETYNLANLFMRSTLPIFICIGINIIMSAYYTSVQCAGASATIAFLRTLFLPIILILTLPNLFGFNGLLSVLVVGEGITFIVALLLFKNRKPNMLIRGLKPKVLSLEANESSI